MEQVSPLHSCSEGKPSSRTKTDQNCLDALSKYYAFVNVLGAGVSGLTIRVSNGEHHLAMKILEADQEAYDEVDVSCKVNSLTKESHVFNIAHGWANRMIDEDFDDAEELLEAVKGNKRLLFIVLELNTYKFNSVGFNKTDIMLALFLLLHGIATARKEFPHFRHRGKRVSDITVGQYNVPGVIYLPKLIDFGESRFRKQRHATTPRT